MAVATTTTRKINDRMPLVSLSIFSKAQATARNSGRQRAFDYFDILTKVEIRYKAAKPTKT